MGTATDESTWTRACAARAAAPPALLKISQRLRVTGRSGFTGERVRISVGGVQNAPAGVASGLTAVP
jgi:hypothetical protein